MSNVTINKVKLLAGGALYSSDSNHVVTTADQIYDELRGCYVNEYDFSGNVKSVNGELPDQNGNIKLPIYYFYKNTGETVYKCLDGLTNVDLTTQELQNLYSLIINYVPNEVNNTYLFNSRIPLTISIINGDTVQFIGADLDLYRENALNYIQINLNASGEITGTEITLPYIKDLQISNNNLVVETNTTTKNLPLPIVLANWALQDSDQLDFIKNKPLQYYIFLGDNNTEWTVATYPPVDNPFLRLIIDLNNYVDLNNLNLNLQRINIGDGTGRMVHPIAYDNYLSTYYFSYIEGNLSVPSENLYYSKIKCNNQGIFQYVESTRLNLEAGNNVEINNGSINVDLSSTEIKSNKVEAITEENKESVTNYPSVKALVDYIDSQNPLETALEAENLAQFLTAARTISENTSTTQRYRLKIKGIIDFANPSDDDKAATIKWKNNNAYPVYNEAERCWNFEGIFMYTVIQGDSSNATLKTTYIENGAIDTVSIKAYHAVFENITIGGTPLTNPSTIYHNWSRPLFIGTNNVYFKFTNCTFTILGHNSVDNPNNCKLIKAIADSNTHLGTGSFQFYHTNIIFITCTWNSGRNVTDGWDNMSTGNLANAEITLDFSEDSIDAYKKSDKTRSLQIISNIKQIRFSNSSDNVDKDLPEIGIPRFYINCYDTEKWSVISDAHALITSNNPSNINYYATININDLFFTNPIYVKSEDVNFNNTYALKTYIQDLENRIKTLETRLNTN